MMVTIQHQMQPQPNLPGGNEILGQVDGLRRAANQHHPVLGALFAVVDLDGRPGELSVEKREKGKRCYF